jgi:glycosidase
MFKRQKDESKLNNEIDRVLGYMQDEDPPTSEKYDLLLTNAERLVALTDRDNVRKPMSWDALVTAGAGLLGILVIVAYEQKHAFTSKALGRVPKP